MKTFSRLLNYTLALTTLALTAATASAADPSARLSIDNYLSQVDQQNRDVKAAQEGAEGAGLRSAETKLIYAPIFFAESQWVNDHKTNSLFPGAYQKLRNDTYSLGVSQQTSFGLSGTLSYSLLSYYYVGSRPRFWEGMPKIELSLSLLRNGLGSETRAQAELVEAAALATQYSQSFQAKAIRAEAESAYIRLATARELRTIHEDSLKRAQDILNWNNRRFGLNLGESSDLYQAQANYESVKLQLQSARDAERTASRDFNRLRQVDADEVTESLDLPDIASVQIPSRGQYRDDVRAAIENTRVASANATLGKERNKPVLEAYGAYALNSRDFERSQAISDSFSQDSMGPTSVVGLRFRTPILVGAQTDTLKGYGKEKAAAESLKDQKLFNQEVEWKQLALKLDEAKKRFEIAKKLVEIQKKKAETEQVRLRRGRSTTYQTLIFDQDLNLAQAARIQVQGEILALLAQMKTYQ